MQIPVTDPEEIGRIARRVRRLQRVRQDDLGATIGVSHVTLREIERGKPTVQWGTVLSLLDELGIKLVLDVPDRIGAELERQPRTGDRRGDGA